MAPEAFDPEEFGGIGCASDVWAMGCCLLEMLSGSAPWGAERHQVIARKVCDKRLAPPIPSSISEPISVILSTCFCYSPRARPPALEVSTHLQALAAERPSGANHRESSATHTSCREPQAQASSRLLNAADGLNETTLQSVTKLKGNHAHVRAAAAATAAAAAIHERESWLKEHSDEKPSFLPLPLSKHHSSDIVDDQSIHILSRMGFKRSDCENALKSASGDMRRAALLLCE